MADGNVTIKVDVEEKEAKKKLEDIEDAAEEAGDGLEDLGAGAGKGEKGLDALDIAAGNFVAGGLSSLISGFGDAVGSLLDLADETRDFRDDMAKLDTAFNTAGHKTEDAQKAYEDFYAILGESDRSVEAVNHLAELTNNTEELAQWSTIAAGVTAKFGDSLPIEGLTEAANETAKVGQTTGVLADALNWASADSAVFSTALGGNKDAMAAFNKAVSEGANVEDAFTAALQKMGTEQERSAAITTTLNGLYETAAIEYNTLTESTQAARRATAEQEEAQARLGAAIEPFKTKLTELQTSFLNLGASIIEGFMEVPALVNYTSALTEEQQKLVETSLQVAENFNNLKLSADEAAIGISSQFNYTTLLANELFTLADNSGRVQEADKARVEFILGELNSALGTEYTMTGNLIQNYQTMRDSIYETINAKKAQILLAEYEDTYAEAIKNVALLEDARALQAIEVGKARTEWEEADTAARIAREQKAAETSSYIKSGASIEDAKALGELQKNAEDAKRVLDSKVDAYKTLDKGVNDSYAAISAYEQASTLMLEGETQKAISVLNDYGKGFNDAANNVDDATKSELELLKQKVLTTSTHLGLLEEEYKEKQGSMTDTEKEEMEKRIELAKQQAQDAMREYVTVGGNMVEGVVKGINDSEYKLTGAMRDIVRNAIEVGKDEAEIKSPSRVTRDEIGLMLSEGVAKGITDGQKGIIKSVQETSAVILAEMIKAAEAEIKWLESEYDKQSELRNEKNKEEIDAKKKLIKAEIDAVKERKNVLTNYERTLENQLNKYTSLQENYAKSTEKLVEDTTKSINAAVDSYENAYDSKYNSLRNSLGLFSFAEEEKGGKGETLKDMLQSQVDMFKDYNEELGKLSERGVNENFVDELKNMGIDVLPQLRAINNMTDEELSEYVSLWEEKNTLALRATESAMDKQRKETIAEIERLKLEAHTKLQELNTTFRTDLIGLTAEIATGMNESGNAGLIELGKQIKSYTDVGQDMMEGVAKGIEKGESAVVNSLLRSVKSALDAAKGELDINSPSKVTEDEIGVNMALGVGSGWDKKLSELKNKMSGGMSDIIERMRTVVAEENSRFGARTIPADTSMSDLAQVIGMQTSGINALAYSNSGRTNTRQIIIEVDKRELGRAVVDVGGIEETRVGAKLSIGGAK